MATMRQYLKAMPSSTFFYSTIFAAAVVVDAKAKQDRRDQWDTAIANAKEGLEGINEETSQLYDETRLDLVSRGGEVGKAEITHDLAAHALQEQDFLSNSVANDISSLIPFDTWRPDADRPRWPLKSGCPLSLPPQSLWSSRKVRMMALEGHRWTTKKLRMSEAQTALFIMKCLEHAQLHEASIKQSDGYPESLHTLLNLSREELKMAIKQTKHYASLLAKAPHDLGDNPPQALDFFPSYKEDAFAEYYVIRDQMNSAIHRCFNKYEAQEISFKSLITLVCHNLITSSAAPDVRTYNILISKLSRLNEWPLVDAAISGSRIVCIRPNEITCATILNHYTVTNNPTKFSEFVALMRCVFEWNGKLRGLMAARPNIAIKEDNENRLVRISEDEVLQKVYPTPLVFNAILNGIVKFAGFRRALEICSALRPDGWRLDSRGLAVELYGCLERKDWEKGLSLWTHIQRLKHRDLDRLPKRTYDVMLALCQACGKQTTFQDVFAEALDAGYSSKMLSSGALRILQTSQEPTDEAHTSIEHCGQELGSVA